MAWRVHREGRSRTVAARFAGSESKVRDSEAQLRIRVIGAADVEWYAGVSMGLSGSLGYDDG